MSDIQGAGQDGMLTVHTAVTYDQLKRAQARAEERGIHGDDLREVLEMLGGRMLSVGGSS